MQAEEVLVRRTADSAVSKVWPGPQISLYLLSCQLTFDQVEFVFVAVSPLLFHSFCQISGQAGSLFRISKRAIFMMNS